MTARARFEAIGTAWEIETAEPLPPEVDAEVHAVIDRYDRAWSRFRPDSLVTRIARDPGTWTLPPEAGPLLGLYRRLYDATGGRFSPLVGRALERLGYDAAYSLRPHGPALPVPAWEDVLAWDGETLTTVRPVLLDVGAAGKGQLVDLVGGVLDAAGIRDWTVDAGGDILVRGASARIGLEHPGDATRAVGVVTIGDRAIAASAPNRRAWGDGLHHVIDPTTGLPTRGLLATWAIAPSAMEADGLATALFFADPERLRAQFDLEWATVRPGAGVACSPGFTQPPLHGEVFA